MFTHPCQAILLHTHHLCIYYNSSYVSRTLIHTCTHTPIISTVTHTFSLVVPNWAYPFIHNLPVFTTTHAYQVHTSSPHSSHTHPSPPQHPHTPLPSPPHLHLHPIRYPITVVLSYHIMTRVGVGGSWTVWSHHTPLHLASTEGHLDVHLNSQFISLFLTPLPIPTPPPYRYVGILSLQLCGCAWGVCVSWTVLVYPAPWGIILWSPPGGDVPEGGGGKHRGTLLGVGPKAFVVELL